MNKPFFSILIFAALVLCSCSSPSVENKETKKDTLTSVSKDPTASGDTFQVFGPSIIFMWPDSIQGEQMKSKDSDAFYTAADDYSFYNSQLMDIADSIGIKNFSTSAKYIDFTMTGNKHVLINRSSSEELWWGLYLYNGIDSPRLQSTVDIDSKFLKNFFKQ